jgi:hypothetical protein
MDQYLLTVGWAMIALLQIVAGLRVWALRNRCNPADKKIFGAYILFHLCISIPFLHLSFVVFQGHVEYQKIILGWTGIATLIAMWGLW